MFYARYCRESCAQVYNLTLSIEEGLPARTIVGDIRAGLPQNTQTSGFFISESRDSYVFRDLEIDTDTGIISTAVVLDREKGDRYEFVAATLTGEVIKVIIVVKDVNDHAPVFPSPSVLLNVSELSPPGTRFELEGARDQDEGDLGTQGYRITDSMMQELFKVEVRSGVGSVDLILLDKLDRESRDFYNLTIEAFDGGIPQKTGRLHVHINVMDENDNPPVFNQTEYRVLVWENAQVFTPVCQVYATDLDLGVNGLVTYEINRRQSDPNEYFIIDENTGVISVNRPLDHEMQTFYELIVRAWDGGIQPESSSTFVGIRVLDINDNSPTINVLFLSASGDPEVSEGASLGEYVARISVTDPDLGEGNMVYVDLQGGDGKFILKQTDDFLYSLCVARQLDREEVDFYELKVIAADLGVPPLQTEKTVLVRVSDVNDNAPVFELGHYEAHIVEDAKPGSALIQVRAHDADEGLNSDLLYSILESKWDSLISIDPQSGLITTATSLDREREAELHFLVVAADGGFPPMSSTTTVTIYIEDINDNKPVFDQQLYNVSIPEHIAVGSCFLQVTAVDADGSEFGVVRYSLSDGFDREDQRPLFHINPVTGEICVDQDIDRDAGLVTYDLQVKAEDQVRCERCDLTVVQGGLSAQAYVHIEVEDLNDNAPVFNPERYVTSISGHTQPGTEILNVIATDQDYGRYGQITYELQAGDSSSLFSVDRTSGAVYLTSTLSHLGSASVKFSISAQDSEGRTSARPANVTVHILHSEQAPAMFQRSHYVFSVAEDAPMGTIVGMVEALNPANSVESLSYRISSGDPQALFSVDAQTGVITTRHPLDHETLPYALLIIQSHSGTSPMYSSTQVNISITDINDSPPTFPRPSDTITVSQNTLPGTLLFIAHAHDGDSGSNGRIRYSLFSGEKFFSIDPVLGTLWLNGSLSHEKQASHTVEILAEDEGSPVLSSRLTLTVEVDQSSAAEDALAFETLVYQVEIRENAQRDTRVIQVRAHLSPQGRAASTPAGPGLTYTLESLSDTPPFLIHPESGWMFLSDCLDYEVTPVYRFRVRASASDGETEVSAVATVVVLVLDENDNAPVFSRTDYFFTMQEGPAPLGLIGTVKATDRDSGKNAQLSFILLSDGKHFRINSKTGEIINWVALDREQQTQHTLKVMVTDQGHPRLNATATVHILVTDINDNPPQFTHLPTGKELNLQVWAGLPVGSVITSMFAKDLDAGENGTVKFSLETDVDHFEIDQRSGDIRTRSPFSQSPQTHYTMIVIARDCGPSPLEERAVIHLQILNIGRVNARSESSIKHFSVRENAKLGTVVGSLGLPRAPAGQVRYSIAEGDGSLHFGVDASSGDLYVAQPLDYEATQRYSLSVRAEALPAVNASMLVAVMVRDVNDHAPWFPGADAVLSLGVYEDVAVGTAVYAFNARDADGSLRYSALRYSLTFDPSSGHGELPFQVHPSTGVLMTTAPLDRERSPMYIVTVTASDQPEKAANQKQVSITAQVFLLDVNDNSPVFVSADTIRVLEDTQVGSLVHHVIARDTDEGRNGQVTYSLLSGNEEGLFALENTGLLHLTSPLDYESRSAHTLTILASDGGHPSLSSTQALTVSVGDVNDQAPQFQQSVYNASVSENREPGEHVITVTASDGDSAPQINEKDLCLLPGPGYNLFSINSHTGEIHTAAHLDRELHQAFTLRVHGRDSGLPSLSGTTTILCSVLDENDNAPEFMQPTVHISIPENLPPGVVHTAQASDPDSGPNSTITYTLEDDEAGSFAINPTTGAVSVTQPLDREERDNYTLLITATDQGPTPRSSTSQLHVTLLDENDHSPAFTRKSYRATVSEALPVGSEVLRLSARDPDLGPSGEVTFSLAEDSLGAFSVEPSTGVVRASRPLDRETRSQYSFRAVATDGCTQGPRSSVAMVTVQVEDVNDNAPACLSEPVRGSVTLGMAKGKTVAVVVAEDPDQGTNGTVVFSLTDGGDVDDGGGGGGGGVFEIGRTSGEVRLMRPLPDGASGTRNVLIAGDITVKEQSCLDYESNKRAHLVVLAENSQQTTYARVTVNLQDVNDNMPTFKQAYYRTAVWEGQIHNTYVMQAFATDADSGVNGQLDYSIVSGNHNDAFIIDSMRGILATNTVLDREIVSSYKLVLQAVDRGSPPLTGTSTVRVQVVDVNDNSPAIPPMEPVVIAENVPPGSVVTQVTANDVDLSSTVTYRLLGDIATNGSFAIDRYTGVISVTRSLDHEEVTEYVLRVQASDSVHQTEADVHVHVLDVNDNTPAFSQESYQVTLPELTSSDTFVLAVSATDRDSGLNGKISYRLLSSPLKGFYIDAQTGSVFTNKPLKYVSDGNMIQLLVEARDSGDPSLSSVTSVDIQVLDANDHAPYFLQNTYQVTSPEDTPLGSTLLTLTAEDEDYSGENTFLEYAITGGNEERHFCLEVITVHLEDQPKTVAQLVLCDSLDRETTEAYSLTVTVSDRGVPSLNSSATVSVTVLDVNDHAPAFGSSEYHAQVRENSPPGTFLVQVAALDPDQGLNGMVKYDIVSGNSKGHLRLDSLTGVLEVNHTLDYEEESKYTLTIQASDGEVQGNRRVSFAVIFISVQDENDNSPYFTHPTVNCSVLENQPAFTPVCMVHAIDQDAGPFGRVIYSILTSCFMDYGSGNPDRKEAFAIDPLTGDIHTRQTFDYERENEYCFVVEARDKGDQVATVRVQVDVEGVDEFSPVFTQKLYRFLLPENSRLGHTLGQVMAMDHDGGLDGAVEYSLAEPSPFFGVNKTTGAVYISGPVYRRRGSSDTDGMVELRVLAGSPKFDSRSSSCMVIVNISNSAEALTGMSLSVQTVSLSAALTIFLLLLVSFVALVLRYKTKEAALKKAASIAANLNHGTGTFGRQGGSHQNGINLHEMRGQMRAKLDISRPLQMSDRSLRGSAEGETAEDQEIKMINEYTCFKRSGSALSDQESQVLDSGLARDSDQLSCHSEEREPPVTSSFAVGLGAGMASAESLHNFKEEGGGEGMLPRVLNVRDVEDTMRGYVPLSDTQASVGGSLASLICPEEQLRGSYSWDYLLNWEPRFQPLASVFTDIGSLPDEEAAGHSSASELASLMRPPPLITAVAQPGIRAVPPRMPPKMPTLGRRPSYPKYAYSPLGRNTGLTPSAMTPSFSPSLSLLTMRTPNASPVVSETGLGVRTKTTTLPGSFICDGEIQV
ncbi:protocadherin-23 [Alosa pseudoharengus]|uniref:protocadherin-23 n=1 Tax=Alosa pseudoharengus TaxID=34774 RepID=UPI003F8926F4